MSGGTAVVFLVAILVLLCGCCALDKIAQESVQIVDNSHRNLQTQTGQLETRRDSKRANAKAERVKRLLQTLESVPTPDFFKKDPSAPAHNPKGPAIFAAAMSVDMRHADVMHFAGTARKADFNGDLVLAVLPNSMPGFLDAVKQVQAISYTVNPDCTGSSHAQVCSFPGFDSFKVSINMVRFYMYQWWARQYDEDALIMVSDFRDVFFQANPFTYKTFDWAPPVAQMVVFQEVFPNKVIYRCPFNGGWIEGCYGTAGLKRIGSNTVSCSGVSIGTRNAIIIYV